MPLSPLGVTPGQLSSLKREPLGGLRHRRVSRPFRHAYGSALPCVGRDGVGLSPVSVVSHCVQASPPLTLTVRDPLPHQGPRTSVGPTPAVLQPARGHGTPSGPKRGPSRTILAWPLRRRPSPVGAGCVALAREFEQGLPYGYGPARVGLARSVWERAHRLRLSRPHLRLTPSPKRKRGLQ